MQLLLQLGHPKINQTAFPIFERVSDVFLHLFRAEEESIYLFWHDVPLRLRYRQDLSDSFDAILAMTWLIQRDQQGATVVPFTTQVLSIQWQVRWQHESLDIQSTCIALDQRYTPYALALNQWPQVQIDRQAFLCEWKTLLHQIIVAFQAGHVTIQDGTERRKWELLQRVEQAIPTYGRFYIRSGQP